MDFAFEPILNISDIIDNETEFIPLLSSEDEEQMIAEKVPEVLPILPLRNTVLFPGVVIPITVGRDKSINLIKESYRGDKKIGVVAQKDLEIEDPKFNDLYKVGTLAHIIKILQMPDGSTTAIIQGKKRFYLQELIQEEPFFIARVTQFKSIDNPTKNNKFKALISSLKDISIQIIEYATHITSSTALAIKNNIVTVDEIYLDSDDKKMNINESEELLKDFKL